MDKHLGIIKASNKEIGNHIQVDKIYSKIELHIDYAKANILRSVNSEMVKAYWLIGKEIVEEEQLGQENAKYGKETLKTLSSKLLNKYKAGFSVDTLELSRKFFLLYQPDSDNTKSEPLVRKSILPNLNPNLSWTHYIKLIRIKNPQARKFYEIETVKNNWSKRELSRQIESMLYERLLKKTLHDKSIDLSTKGHDIKIPEDIIKDPLILEFLGLPETHLSIESKLEQALIDNLQSFLLELGTGFSFIARQKRLTLQGDHFYADLVFYHVILKCYVIIEIKTKALKHEDLGQMLFYVNYFDKEIKNEQDNPTIGLILCTEKNEAIVKYTLGENAKQIFTTKYQFHLPTEQELETELKRELDVIKHQLEQRNDND
ncbi:MAG: hypothetical protein RI883_2142 [Bacteroidota bacterium]|jgi:predicted nuclease of restriction endonuclease-like (RecB) superfamily